VKVRDLSFRVRFPGPEPQYLLYKANFFFGIFKTPDLEQKVTERSENLWGRPHLQYDPREKI
jgi:hypothetical protein